MLNIKQETAQKVKDNRATDTKKNVNHVECMNNTEVQQFGGN